MQAKSIKGKSPAEILYALQQSSNDGFKPTLAVIFLSKAEDVAIITSLFNEQGITIFGASTAEKFNEEGIEPDGIIVLLMNMNPANFNVVVKEFESPALAFKAACEVGEVGKHAFNHPAFIISTADLGVAGGEVIKGLLTKAGNNVPVIGGMAGEPVTFSGTVFTNQSKTNSGVIALIVDEDKVDVKGVAVSGWKPIGTEKKITKSKGNWVYTIDDEPAVAVIKKFLGKEMVVNDKSIGIDSSPLQVQRPSGKPMMRPIILWNHEEQSIMLGAPVDEGAMFRFSLPPDLEVIDEVIGSKQQVRRWMCMAAAGFDN